LQPDHLHPHRAEGRHGQRLRGQRPRGHRVSRRLHRELCRRHPRHPHGNCVVTVSSATTVTATFNLQANTLTVQRVGTGSGSVASAPAGITCGADCTENYAPGTNVTLTATATAGSVFAGWSGGGCSGTGTCVVSLTAST